MLSQSGGQIIHVLLTRPPLWGHRSDLTARLACLKRAASVRSEPGSNSPLFDSARKRAANFFSSSCLTRTNFLVFLPVRSYLLTEASSFSSFYFSLFSFAHQFFKNLSLSCECLVNLADSSASCQALSLLFFEVFLCSTSRQRDRNLAQARKKSKSKIEVFSIFFAPAFIIL